MWAKEPTQENSSSLCRLSFADIRNSVTETHQQQHLHSNGAATARGVAVVVPQAPSSKYDNVTASQQLRDNITARRNRDLSLDLAPARPSSPPMFIAPKTYPPSQEVGMTERKNFSHFSQFRRWQLQRVKQRQPTVHISTKESVTTTTTAATVSARETSRGGGGMGVGKAKGGAHAGVASSSSHRGKEETHRNIVDNKKSEGFGPPQASPSEGSSIPTPPPSSARLQGNWLPGINEQFMQKLFGKDVRRHIGASHRRVDYCRFGGSCMDDEFLERKHESRFAMQSTGNYEAIATNHRATSGGKSPSSGKFSSNALTTTTVPRKTSPSSSSRDEEFVERSKEAGKRKRRGSSPKGRNINDSPAGATATRSTSSIQTAGAETAQKESPERKREESSLLLPSISSTLKSEKGGEGGAEEKEKSTEIEAFDEERKEREENPSESEEGTNSNKKDDTVATTTATTIEGNSVVFELTEAKIPIDGKGEQQQQQVPLQEDAKTGVLTASGSIPNNNNNIGNSKSAATTDRWVRHHCAPQPWTCRVALHELQTPQEMLRPKIDEENGSLEERKQQRAAQAEALISSSPAGGAGGYLASVEEQKKLKAVKRAKEQRAADEARTRPLRSSPEQQQQQQQQQSRSREKAGGIKRFSPTSDSNSNHHRYQPHHQRKKSPKRKTTADSSGTATGTTGTSALFGGKFSVIAPNIVTTPAMRARPTMGDEIQTVAHIIASSNEDFRRMIEYRAQDTALRREKAKLDRDSNCRVDKISIVNPLEERSPRPHLPPSSSSALAAATRPGRITSHSKNNNNGNEDSIPTLLARDSDDDDDNQDEEDADYDRLEDKLSRSDLRWSEDGAKLFEKFRRLMRDNARSFLTEGSREIDRWNFDRERMYQMKFGSINVEQVENTWQRALVRIRYTICNALEEEFVEERNLLQQDFFKKFRAAIVRHFPLGRLSSEAEQLLGTIKRSLHCGKPFGGKELHRIVGNLAVGSFFVDDVISIIFSLATSLCISDVYWLPLVREKTEFMLMTREKMMAKLNERCPSPPPYGGHRA